LLTPCAANSIIATSGLIRRRLLHERSDRDGHLRRPDCGGLRVIDDNVSIDFIAGVGASLTPIAFKSGAALKARKRKYVALDIDVFPMDNSRTKKEGVSYTYKGFNGDAPLAAYLGEDGWCLACELRPGSQHGQMEFIHFLERVPARRCARMRR
jgi:hypothetical protein